MCRSETEDEIEEEYVRKVKGHYHCVFLTNRDPASIVQYALAGVLLQPNALSAGPVCEGGAEESVQRFHSCGYPRIQTGIYMQFTC